MQNEGENPPRLMKSLTRGREVNEHTSNFNFVIFLFHLNLLRAPKKGDNSLIIH